MSKKNDVVTFQPLTPETWPDLEELFGPRGGRDHDLWFMSPKSFAN